MACTKIFDNAFGLNFAGATLHANGQQLSGDAYPAGIDTHIQVVNGAYKATLLPGDALTALGHRCEVLAPNNGAGEYWYVWEMMIKAVEWTNVPSSVPIAVMSIHDIPDGGDAARHPNFGLRVINGLLAVDLPSVDPPTELQVNRRAASINFEFDRWYRFCLHANWQPDTTGFREFFVDGVPYIREFNRGTHYVDAAGPYFKFGVYDHTSSYPADPLSAHFRNLQIWSGSGGAYEGIMGTVPLPPKRLVGAV